VDFCTWCTRLNMESGISLAQGLLREEVWYLEGVVAGWPTNDQNVTVRADGQTGTTEMVRVDGQTRICRRRTGMWLYRMGFDDQTKECTSSGAPTWSLKTSLYIESLMVSESACRLRNLQRSEIRQFKTWSLETWSLETWSLKTSSLKTSSLKKFSVLSWEGKGAEASDQRTNARMLLHSTAQRFELFDPYKVK